MVCSFSVHCGQCRREDVSVQLMWNSWRTEQKLFQQFLTYPKAGLLQPGKWLCWAEVEHYFQCIQRKHLSLKLQRILPYLDYLMQKIMVPGRWLLTGSCYQSLSPQREEKMTSHQTITDINTFVKSRNTQRFYKILSRHWSWLKEIIWVQA